MQPSLFRLPDEDPAAYVPTFSREDVDFHLVTRTYTQSQYPGFGVYDEDYDKEDPKKFTEYKWTIPPENFTITQTLESYRKAPDIGVILNGWMKDKFNEKSNPKEYEWLKKNGHQLNRDRRYWHGVELLEIAEKARRKAAVALNEAERATHHANVALHQARTGVLLKDEKEIEVLALEFGRDDIDWDMSPVY